MEQARVGIRAYRSGFFLIAAFLLVALILPVCAVLWQSFLGKNGEIGLQNWTKVLSDPEFFALLGRSFLVAGLSAFLSAVIAFFAAYGLTFTNIDGRLKKGVQIVLLLPLFLPGASLFLQRSFRLFPPFSQDSQRAIYINVPSACFAEISRIILQRS